MNRQYWPREQLDKFRFRRLKMMLDHAYSQCHYYRTAYDQAGIHPDDIRCLDDLVHLPIVEKIDVQEMTESFITFRLQNYVREIEKALATGEHPQDIYHHGLIFRRTSGSTGKRLIILIDPGSWDELEAIYARSLFATGHGIRELLAVSTPYAVPAKRWFARVGLMRKTYVPLSLPVEKQAHILAGLPLCDLYSYPTNLMALVRIGCGKSSGFNFRRIICTAEILTETARLEIEKAFQCPVFDHYGTMEFNRMAWECEHKSGLHEDIDSVIMEIVRDGRPADPGEKGEIVVTGLVNKGMPLIRYRLGDILVKGETRCQCGRSLPLLRKIEGRSNDYIVTRDGTLVSPTAFDTALCSVPGVKQLKLVQRDVDTFDLQLIPGIAFDMSACENKARNIISKILNNASFVMNINVVEVIPRSPGGKLQSVVSDLSRGITKDKEISSRNK